jgi:GNAT superfamily N-acetyltransferase
VIVSRCDDGRRCTSEQEGHVAEVFIRRLSRWQAEQQREAIADGYVESYRRVHGEEFHDRQRFLEIFAGDVQRPGFDMVVADMVVGAGPKSTGYAYGFLLDRAGEWWRGLRQDVSWDIEELTVAGQVFALAELMVLPPYRRTGVATRLLDRLLMRSNATLVTVRVDPANDSALAALRNWGFERLGTVTAPLTAVPSVGTGTPSDIWGRVRKP